MPASPALNPAERVCLDQRECYLLHRMLINDYEAVLEAVCRARSRLLDNTGFLALMTAYRT
ncbi:hypothetical protein [Microvirga arabica]|uniref:hypothetical protein n=1 Tax=Microvirga arabica TaxID=1128671 RepID=UPI001939E66E|nr:hypothetical protein [Microvirga arabica]MBM1174375.1 hypothetical protein [Microvirga arabica]